ncbi:YugN family protein [Salicibibacter kimchii]|nr:YugN family protein [Salicibibacter kimchii]
MLELRSQISGLQMPMKELEQKVKPFGFTIESGWEYDDAYMDYQMADNHGYHFLRIPFSIAVGENGSRDATVVLGMPFLFSHRYQSGLDHEGITAYSALWNQFSSQEEKDTYIDQAYVREGVMLVRELEQALST